MRKWIRIRQLTLVLLSVICSEILLPVGGLMVSAAANQLAPERPEVLAAATIPAATLSDAEPPETLLPEATLPDAMVPDIILPETITPGAAIPVATGADAAMPAEPPADSDHLLSEKSPDVRMVKPATPSDADWVEAATFEEMESAMSSSRKIRLVDDIIISGFHYIISSMTEPTYIDTAGHTIYVEGIVTVYGTVVSGRNREGLFYVRKGGLLGMYGTTLQPEGGYAFWQEEGSGLIHDTWISSDETMEIPCSFDGRLHYAGSPAAWYPEGGFDWWSGDQDARPDPYYLFEAGTPYDSEVLPKEAAGYWCLEGKLHSGRLPVEWNEEECREELEKRERTLLTGSYGAGMVTLHTSVPKLLTVFQKEEAGVWLTCEYWEHPNIPRVFLDFLPARPDSDPEDFMLEVSVDGTEWELLESVRCNGPDSDGVYTYNRYFNVWSGESVPQYFCIRVQGHETEFYSDVVMITEEYSFARGDIDGTRGGGTEIGDTERPSVGDTADKPNAPLPGDSNGTSDSSLPGDSNGTSDSSKPGDSNGTSDSSKPEYPAGPPAVSSQGGAAGGNEGLAPGGSTETPNVRPQENFNEKTSGLLQENVSVNSSGLRQEDTGGNSSSQRQEDHMENPDDLSDGNSSKDLIPVKLNEPTADRDAVKEAAAFPAAGRMVQLLTGWAATAGIVGLTIWLPAGGRKKKGFPPSKE